LAGLPIARRIRTATVAAITPGLGIFLTGMQARKLRPLMCVSDVSVDQVAAAKIGRRRGCLRSS